ncbi:MAG: four helix bundle protein [Candidatus Marinimicrobia bacterium]|nr:four helix bundle protein [Candidatus Neomarinimicrobiota bacterium]
MKTHEDLDVWQKSIILLTNIYSITDILIDNKKFELAKQMRRAAVFIPSNIAEGAARASDKDFAKFLYYSLGSLTELETQLIVSKRIGLLDNNDIISEINKIKQMLLGLIRFLKNRIKN